MSQYVSRCWGCGTEINYYGPGYCNTCRQEKAMKDQAERILSAFSAAYRNSQRSEVSNPVTGWFDAAFKR